MTNMTTLLAPIETAPVDAFDLGGTVDNDLQARHENASFVASIREMANFFERHPTMQAPIYPTIHIFAKDREGIAAIAREIGGASKSYSDDFLTLVKHFGNIELRVCVDREQVCRRVDEVIEVEESVPTGFEVRTVTKTVTKWECDEPLLAAA